MFAVALAALASGCAGPSPAASISGTPALADCSEASESTAPASFARSPGGVPEVGVDWLEAHHCGVRVIDVRSEEERRAGALSFSEHLPLESLAAEAATWDPNEAIVFVCRSGRRSARATRELEDLGFSRVASLAGGMMLWEQSGRAVQGATLDPDALHETSDASVETGEPLSPPAYDLLPYDLETPSEAAREAESPPEEGAWVPAVMEHLVSGVTLRWEKAGALLIGANQSCVDGRDAHPVVGTPGGDAGELLLALAVLEAERGRPLTAAELRSHFDAYLSAFGRFYMHSDEGALAFLATDPRFSDAVGERGLSDFLAHPPAQLEAELAEVLSEPEHVGCGHLRLVLSHPEAYGVRVELARSLIQLALRRRWQGEPVDFVVLSGDHRESAVLNIHVDAEIHAFTRIPTVAPRVADKELFVHHPEVSAWIRRENAAFLFASDPWLRARPDRRDAFLERLERMGEGQLHETLERLAGDLPVYEARVIDDRVELAPSLGLG